MREELSPPFLSRYRGIKEVSKSSSSPTRDSQRGWVCLHGSLDLGPKLAEEGAAFQETEVRKVYQVGIRRYAPLVNDSGLNRALKIESRPKNINKITWQKVLEKGQKLSWCARANS